MYDARVRAVVVLVLACGGSSPPAAKAPVPRAPSDAAIDSAPAPPPRPHARGNPSSSLIPRVEFFASTRYSNVRISPDGKRFAWIEPRTNIAMPYVAPLGHIEQAALVATDTTRPVTGLIWTFDAKHILYVQDANGDGNAHLFRWDVDTAKVADLVPIKGARVDLMALGEKKLVALVGINDRDSQADDIYTVDLATGDKQRVLVNDDKLAGFVIDHDLRVRFATKVLADNSAQILVRDGAAWRVWDTIPADERDTFRVLGIDPRGARAWVVDARGRDTAAVFSVDIATKQRTLVAADPKVDASSAFVHPATGALAGVGFSRIRPRWVVIDKSLAADAAALDKIADGSWELTSATRDGAKWMVAYSLDTQPGKYFVYDRKTKTAQFVFDMTPSLASFTLARMHGYEVAARDGLALVAYVSLPRDRDPRGDGSPDQPLPLVVLVGPDPSARESLTYDPLHQLFASRGYAVMSVNFRGVGGYGKAFSAAGAREWGKRMEDDLVDAVRWAVGKKIADGKRVGIVGLNYGGYAALMGVATAGDTFACAADILGPADLATYAKLTAPQLMGVFAQRIGDPSTAEGVAALRAISPLARAAEIAKPLLVVHSGEQVAGADVAKLVDIASVRAPVSFIVFPDETGTIARAENDIAMLAAIEAFLSEQLGGWFAPLEAPIAKASSMKIVRGAEYLPGF